ncbi:MAG: protease pro-enzyme activation domain-containing protein [Limisphaerales bacterium]
MIAGCAALSLLCPSLAHAKPNTHIPAAVAHSKAVGHMAANEHVRLAIALSPKDRQAIKDFADSVSDPSSPNFRHYITPEEFGTRFGATDQDYAALQDWAKSKGMTVSKTYKNHLLLSVEASVDDVEKAFNVSMNVYQHPKEARTFFSADREPTIDAPVTISSIEGLSSYWKPHVKSRKASNAAPKGGTGPSGAYLGSDFRKAYVPGTTLNGHGETVGLLQFDGFYAADIAKYRALAGIPNIPLTIVKIDGGVTAIDTDSSGEVSLDIEMCMSMAPGLNRIYVYEAPNPSPWMDLIGRMADDNLSRQLSCSWGGGDPDDAIEVTFQQMAAQGQSFFNATGDSDAFDIDFNPIQFPSESPSITQVGGTTLSTSGAGAWTSEVVWNWGYIASIGEWIGSSGGISDYYDIPSYQQGMDMTKNKGSTDFRNVPDVALTGDNVYVTYGNGLTGTFGGTSCAAPLWAGFMSLVNQTNIANSQPAAGFINPFIYSVGRAKKAGAFHDVISGNNTNDFSAGLWKAVAGYDLCTGWGSPGTNLLNLFYQVNFTLADLAMTGTNGPAPAALSAPYVYDYVITNKGVLGTTNAVFTADFSSPVGVSSVSVSQGGFSSNSTNVTCLLGTIASNGTAHVTVTIVPATSGFLTNIAAISSEVPDPRPTNNVVATVVLVNPADLGIGKVAPATVFVGYPMTYTISVTNFGPLPATGVTVADTLPGVVGFVGATTSQGDFNADTTSGTVTFNVGYLDVNYVATMTITVTAPTDPQTITNSATVTANEPDLALTNNDTTATTQVVPLPPPVYNVNAIGYPTAAIINWNSLSNGTTQVAYGLTSSYGSISTLDVTPHTNHSVLLTGLVPDRLYYFQITSVVNGTPFTATGTFTTTATLILQEPDSLLYGLWTFSSASGDKYGSSFQYANTTTDPYTADATAIFNATLPVAGQYDVAMWSPSGSNHTTNCQVYVVSSAFTIFASIDQSVGGHWVSLGSNLSFPDATASIQLQNNTGEQNKEIIANAVKFSYSLGQDKPVDGSVPGWWSQYYLGTNSVSGSADADDDGYSNFTEYVLGTAPNDPTSHLSFSSKSTTNGVQIVFGPYQAGRVYQLQYRANFNSPWANLANTATADANGNGTFTINSALTGFFRLRASLAP